MFLDAGLAASCVQMCRGELSSVTAYLMCVYQAVGIGREKLKR